MKSWAMIPLALGALTMSGCATVPGEGHQPPTSGDAGECTAAPGQTFVGQRASEEVGRKLLEATGAANLRWVPPRTAVTMDFRADRLTVSYDDDYVITRVSCG